MKQALIGAGLLLGSTFANSAYINLPSLVELDINADPFSFIATTDFSQEDSDPSTYSETPFIKFSMESEHFYTEYDSGGFNPNEGLQYIFAGAGTDLGRLDKVFIQEPMPGELYEYKITANVYHFPLDCDDCAGVADTITASTFISFFDGSAQDVPVGPTGALLLTGLAGIALRKRLG